MATAKAPAKEPETTEPEPEPDPEPVTDEGLIQTVVDKVLAKLDELKPEVKAKPEGRKTYRDEEDEMNELVTSKVKELLDLEKAAGEKHPEPSTDAQAKPEPIPAQPSGRRVERLMGWN